jgi:hypothetical protein
MQANHRSTFSDVGQTAESIGVEFRTGGTELPLTNYEIRHSAALCGSGDEPDDPGVCPGVNGSLGAIVGPMSQNVSKPRGAT